MGLVMFSIICTRFLSINCPYNSTGTHNCIYQHKLFLIWLYFCNISSILIISLCVQETNLVFYSLPRLDVSFDNFVRYVYASWVQDLVSRSDDFSTQDTDQRSNGYFASIMMNRCISEDLNIVHPSHLHLCEFALPSNVVIKSNQMMAPYLIVSIIGLICTKIL